jgi:geranylgeranyl pyrophosphate synthase
MQDKIKTYLQDVRQQVDRAIEQVLENENPLIEGLYKSAAYSTGGGKRVRAVFTYLVGNIFEVPGEQLLTPASAIELIHAASLIMDDLPYMDDSQLRRGKPSNHVVFGQDVALCASIALISEAIRMVLEEKGISDDHRIKMAAVLTRSFGFDGLAAGQYVDLKLKRKNIEFGIIEYINHKKTAALFSAAGQIGAILGQANADQMQAISDFSANIGFAFQIMDDILDVAGDVKVVGKDLEHDKMNFVKLVGMEKAREYLFDYQKRALEALTVFGERAGEITAFAEYLIHRVR